MPGGLPGGEGGMFTAGIDPHIRESNTVVVSGEVPYLPVYNAHPYFEACFQKRSVSTSFLSGNNFLEKFSRNVKSSSICTKISYRS